MKFRRENKDLSLEEAIAIQFDLAKRVVRYDDFPMPIKTIAGVDVAYGKNDERVFAGVVTIDVDSMETIESRTIVGKSVFPYVPGLFAFRELPHLLDAFEKIESMPDLVVCDGQGIAHPRRCGLASHLGLVLDVATIGCGKTHHIGTYENPDLIRGSSSSLLDSGEIIGHVLRTQTEVKPLFVSIGHRVSLDTASSWVLRLASQFRQPEPIRRANELVNGLRASS